MTPTPAPNEHPTMIRIDNLVRHRLDLIADREKIDNQICDIDDVLAVELPKVGGRYELPDCPGQGFRLQAPSRRFDPAKAVAILTPTEYQSICTLTPSASQARKVLPGAVVDQLYTAGDKSSIQALRTTGGGR